MHESQAVLFMQTLSLLDHARKQSIDVARFYRLVRSCEYESS